jgi:hypothetical protein
MVVPVPQLVGCTVGVFTDGYTQANKVVSNAGTITLDEPATYSIRVGLPYNSDGQMLRLDSGSADGTSIGKVRRFDRVSLLLAQTGPGLQVGTDFEHLQEMDFRTDSDDMDTAVPLFTGLRPVQEIDDDYSYEGTFCFRQSNMLPATLLAVMPRMDTSDDE